MLNQNRSRRKVIYLTSPIEEIRKILQEKNIGEDDIDWVGNIDGTNAISWKKFSKLEELVQYDKLRQESPIKAVIVAIKGRGHIGYDEKLNEWRYVEYRQEPR